MRQKLGIALGLLVLCLILIGLNAATYVQQEKTPDNEINPNRSSFNSGVTGTQALYTLLAETGRRVVRWQSPMDALTTKTRNQPSTFVVVGKTRRPFDPAEVKQVLQWVDAGGRLVLIDREPEEGFGKAIAVWRLTHKTNDLELLIGTDPGDQKQMTSGMPASKPVQPTVLTSRVNAVQTSRFASHIEIGQKTEEDSSIGLGSLEVTGQPQPTPHDLYDPLPSPTAGRGNQVQPPPAPAVTERRPQDDDIYGDEAFSAPVVHVVGNQRHVVANIPYGSGEIVFVSDPYIVSNAGVSLVDNAQLAINIIAGSGGLIAFDEFHQGFGSNQNRFFAYFAGTPVIGIFMQIALVIALVMYSRSRRFARAVPEPEPDRRTKLEYVGAIAELQQRTKAYDLAMENIYGDFRRRVSILFGVDFRLSDRLLLAKLIAERIKGDVAEINSVLEKCQEVIHGEPASTKRTIELATRLREIESRLGMDRAVHRRAIR